MKDPRFLSPFVGALVAFVGTLFLVRFLGAPGFDWVATVLKPGIFVAELIENATGSISMCVLGGILTMTLIGAGIGLVIDLLAASDGK
jgi:hypothetical protein